VYVFCAWYVSCVAREIQPLKAKGEPNIGARVKEARELLGLSQIALADRLEAGERTVQAWERNERTPRLDTLTRLGSLAGRPVAWFYGEGDSTERERAA
jgi:transcriptional regulator with XRE-family HTH domain